MIQPTNYEEEVAAYRAGKLAGQPAFDVPKVRITPEYAELNRQLHETRVDYGQMGSRHLESVRGVAQVFNVRSILDYGCGKQTLLEVLRLPYARGYDPCVPGLDADPKPAEFVICTDVLEHVEPECIDKVLDHIRALTTRVIFVVISLRAAKKTLPDGRNTHLIIRPAKWWIEQLMSRFEPDTIRATDTELQAVFRVSGEPSRDPIIQNNVRK